MTLRTVEGWVDSTRSQGGARVSTVPRAWSTGEVAVQVEGVRKSFGQVTALDDVSLIVQPGTVLGLLGPNGAGKTTLVRILTTLLKPDTGRAYVAGYEVVDEADALRRVIGLAGQYAAVDENLTGQENLEMVARLYHLRRREARWRAAELLAHFDLTGAARRPVKGYSGGMRRRLDLAASLVARPQVLFLDEPTTGLDPRSRLELWEVLDNLVAEGMTLLLTTQYLEEADRLADHIAVIDHGRIIAQGTTRELKARVGGDVLDIRIAEQADIHRAVHALTPLSTTAPTADMATGRIVLPLDSGASILANVVRQLDAAEIAIADLSLRRPTLDDAFLALTGRAAGHVSGRLANAADDNSDTREW